MSQDEFYYFCIGIILVTHIRCVACCKPRSLSAVLLLSFILCLCIWFFFFLASVYYLVLVLAEFHLIDYRPLLPFIKVIFNSNTSTPLEALLFWHHVSLLSIPLTKSQMKTLHCVRPWLDPSRILYYIFFLFQNTVLISLGVFSAISCASTM